MGKLTIENIKHCFDNIVKEKKSNYPNNYLISVSLGYLEAGLQIFDGLEVKEINGARVVKREMVKHKKWWKKDREETYEEAIIRQTKKLLDENK